MNLFSGKGYKVVWLKKAILEEKLQKIWDVAIQENALVLYLETDEVFQLDARQIQTRLTEALTVSVNMINSKLWQVKWTEEQMDIYMLMRLGV